MSRIVNNKIYESISSHPVRVRNPLYLSADIHQYHYIEDDTYTDIESISSDHLYSYVPTSKYYKSDTSEKSEKFKKLNISKLPKGWRRLYDKETERYYYACDVTKHTQWLDPSIPIDKIMPNNLPYAWEEKLDEESGKYYYINHVAKFTTWEKPNF